MEVWLVRLCVAATGLCVQGERGGHGGGGPGGRRAGREEHHGRRGLAVAPLNPAPQHFIVQYSAAAHSATLCSTVRSKSCNVAVDLGKSHRKDRMQNKIQTRLILPYSVFYQHVNF